mmetsp:Transcript_41376/g.128605  ORF Transcript_41376/g.128605 Transcript_41376/m.128605 type:complete len:307 (-) Transcript_41376:186-1106(-)
MARGAPPPVRSCWLGGATSGSRNVLELDFLDLAVEVVDWDPTPGISVDRLIEFIFEDADAGQEVVEWHCDADLEIRGRVRGAPAQTHGETTKGKSITLDAEAPHAAHGAEKKPLDNDGTAYAIDNSKAQTQGNNYVHLLPKALDTHIDVTTPVQHSSRVHLLNEALDFPGLDVEKLAQPINVVHVLPKADSTLSEDADRPAQPKHDMHELPKALDVTGEDVQAMAQPRDLVHLLPKALDDHVTDDRVAQPKDDMPQALDRPPEDVLMPKNLAHLLPGDINSLQRVMIQLRFMTQMRPSPTELSMKH